MTDQLRVDPAVLTSSGVTVAQVGADLSAMNLGQSLGGLTSAAPGFQSGALGPQVGTALDDACKKVSERFSEFGTKLQSAAEKYRTTDEALSKKFKQSFGPGDGEDGDGNDGDKPNPPPEKPQIDPSQFGLDETQMKNAQAIVEEGKRLGMDEKAIQIALTTALTESSLRNLANDGAQPGRYPRQSAEEIRESLNYPHDGVGHDHASVGLFQQQLPWYGKVGDLMDPAKATDIFFNGSSADPSLGIENKTGLTDIDYHNMSVWDAAQAVQGSFDPTGGNYKKNADLAARLTDALY